MTSDACKLHELSSELLLLITTYCDGRSLLSLAQTCDTLRRFCADASVYQGALIRNLDEIDEKWSDFRCQTIPHGMLKTWLGNDKKVLERYLLAVTNVENLSSNAMSGTLPDRRRNRHLNADEPTLAVCEYLPQLMVLACHANTRRAITSSLHHMTFKRLMTMSANDPDPIADDDDWSDLAAQDWSSLDHDLHSRIAFMFAVAGLPSHADCPVGEYYDDQARIDLDKFAVEVSARLEDAFETAPQNSPLMNQALLFEAVGVLLLGLRTRKILRVGAKLVLPISNGLRRLDLGIQPPIPFWNDTLGLERSWAAWLSQRTAEACQPHALDVSDEWVGVYEMGRKRRVCDPMMENIHFRMQQEPEVPEHESGELPSSTEMLISAENCLDSVGPFNLIGKIDSMTGRFKMTKHYFEHGFSWRWAGAMTPLGFVGQWGHPGTHHSGFFWLYKRSWCDTSTD